MRRAVVPTPPGFGASGCRLPDAPGRSGRGARLIVINPRRIDLCDCADLWLCPYPGTDVALLNAMAKVIVTEGLTDAGFVHNRTEGYDEWRAVVAQYPPERATSITGVSADDIRAAARIFARPPVPKGAGPESDAAGRGYGGSCLIWGMGITQHSNGTANAHSVLNLALATGHLGRPGCGVSPLRGQNNVQGCGDAAGCLPDSLPGYQGLGANARAKFGDAWDAAGRLPGVAGRVVTDMVESMGSPAACTRCTLPAGTRWSASRTCTAPTTSSVAWTFW